MKAPHLAAGLSAILVGAVVLGAGNFYAHWLISQWVHALAPVVLEIKDQGSVLQRAAFQQPDLLPFYGSSELLAIDNPYHASNLFESYPTGFSVFPVGRPGKTSITMLQDIAAVGPELRGKKVVISLSPPWFFFSIVSLETYAGSFSRLHASELAFSTDLSFELKQAAARRMLFYTDTLEGDPVLRFALERLADGSPASRVLYALVLPLGKLHNQVLRLQDNWETLAVFWGQGWSPEVSRRPAKLDWAALRTRAEAEQGARAYNNAFGFENGPWLRKHWVKTEADQRSRTDRVFLDTMQRSREWDDLDLLLRSLRELGARPLILSMPIWGTYYDYIGVSAGARQVYYERLRQVARAYGVPLLDFAEHDEDPLFMIDPSAHLSRKGWIYYDQALDAFYHGAPGEPAAEGDRVDAVLSGDSRRADPALRPR